MENRRVYVLLLSFGIFLSALGLSEGAPLQYGQKSGKATDSQVKCVVFVHRRGCFAEIGSWC